MTYSLYLDDERDPKTDRDWVVVRSYDEFVQTVEERGCPSYVSFDHDLGEDVPEGKDAAKWFVELAISEGWDLREVGINIHTANSGGGRENIQSWFTSWNRMLEMGHLDLS